jgi:gluconokinase
MVIIVMGPAGSGKSTVGHALADRLGWRFEDADDRHMPANVAKMAAGTALTEGDRAGWLDALHGLIARAIDRRESMVLACSALKAQHRLRLATGLHPVRFVYLKTPIGVLRERLKSRRGHFAGESLLESQLATLEEPADEALTVDGAADVDTTIGRIRLDFGV